MADTSTATDTPRADIDFCDHAARCALIFAGVVVGLVPAFLDTFTIVASRANPASVVTVASTASALILIVTVALTIAARRRGSNGGPGHRVRIPVTAGVGVAPAAAIALAAHAGNLPYSGVIGGILLALGALFAGIGISATAPHQQALATTLMAAAAFAAICGMYWWYTPMPDPGLPLPSRYG